MKLLAAVVLALAFAAPAQAASWRRVAAADSQVGAARTSDGVLHVVWHDGDDLFHTAIRAGGKVGATRPIVTAAGVSDAAIVVVPDGLQVFWTDSHHNLGTAYSMDNGLTWDVTSGAIAGGAQGGVSAATLPGANILQAWPGTWVHAGLDPNVPSADYGTGSFPRLASRSGRAMLAWFSGGVVVQGVKADGTPRGEAMTMPGTVGGAPSRPAIAAHAKAFFVAYADGDVRVWRVGEESTLTLGPGSAVTLVADGTGRVWAAWADSGRVLAARSDRQVRSFGPTVDVGAADGVDSLDASATGSSLDVLARFGGATSVARVRPVLTMVARRHGDRVVFSVSDADDPVRGALVRVGKSARKTNAGGRATLTVRSGATATATHAGYTPAKLRVSAR